MTAPDEVERLVLKIERALLVRKQLLVLVSSAEATIVHQRRELRNLRARIARTPFAPLTKRST
jgi:hypothetical protein